MAALLVAAESAAESPLELTWETPPACPSGGFVQDEVARVVGRPWPELSREWRDARASVRAEGGGYRLRLKLISRSGLDAERSVLAASCTEAAEAAVAILTAGVARALETEPRATEHEPNLAEAGPVDAAAPRAQAMPTPSQPEHSLGFVGARLGMDVGSLARVAPFAQLTGGIELPPVLLSAYVGATGNVNGEIGDTSAGAEMFLAVGGVDACYRFGLGELGLSGCGGAELGSLEARGFGTAERRDARTLWSAGLVRGTLDWYLGPTGTLAAGVTALLPVRRPRVIASPEEVHRTDAVVWRPWLGIGVRFP